MMTLLKSNNGVKFKNWLMYILMLSFIVCGNLSSQTVDTLWSEDWEGNWVVDWHVDAGTWEVGTPTSGPDSAYNGQQCAATVLNGDYATTVDSRMIRHTSFVVPSASQNPRLRFWQCYSFSGYDYGNIQISTDGGTNWQVISTSYTSTGSGVWTYPFIDLSAYADSTVQIAFYFHAHHSGYGSSNSTGWYVDDIEVISGPIVFNNPEGFEAGIGDWDSERGTWEVGSPSSGPGSAYTGQNCAGTDLSGNYATTVDSRLISPVFVVPSALQNPRLRFWQWYSFSGYDYGNIQISTDRGENWQIISTSYSSTGSGVWTYPFIDLSAYADSTVQIAFYFHAHHSGYGSSNSTGWYVDDIEVISGPIVFNNPEGFEAGIGDWDSERGTWEVGSPSSGPDSAYTGQNCAGTDLSGDYATTVDSRLISPVFVLPPVTQNPALQFWHWYSFSGYDYGEIQIKVNGGSWQVISNQFTSTSSGAWTTYYVALTAYADSIVQIAFNFHAHHSGYGSSNSTGWYIDDVNIVGYTSPSIYVSPGVIDFGDVQISRTKYDSVNISNTGNDTLHVSSISFSGNNPTNFRADSTLFNLAPGDSQIIAVNFTPDSVGNFSTTLNINSDGGNISIGLTGNGAPSTGIENKGKIFPTEYSLHQNYPNPFNPVTKIHFGLPKASRVRISIFNVLGQKVTDILNTHKPAGMHQITFNGERLTSGVYYYKIEAGDFVQVKKMLLVK